MADPLPPMPEPEPGFLVIRGLDGSEHLCWSPHTRELAALLASLSAGAAGRALERDLLSCGPDGAVRPCGCTEHLHRDAYGTCACGHSCVWHFEDGATAPCRGLLVAPASS